MGGSIVQVRHVPTGTSPDELRQLFSQLGAVQRVLLSFDGGAAEGEALVAYADAGAAQEAVDLLDAYPVATSLLEVQAVSVHNWVGGVAARMLGAVPSGSSAASASVSGPAGGLARSGGSGGGGSGDAVSALEAEMRELQLALQQQAQLALQQQADEGAWPTAAADDDGGGWQVAGGGGGDEWQDEGGWQVAQLKPRRSGGGGGGGGGGAAEPDANTGLWIGWIDLGVGRTDLARALSRYGPVQIVTLVAADMPGPNKKFYQWAIARFQRVEDAVAAKQAITKQILPGINSYPLKVKFYDPSHSVRRR